MGDVDQQIRILESLYDRGRNYRCDLEGCIRDRVLRDEDACMEIMISDMVAKSPHLLHANRGIDVKLDPDGTTSRRVGDRLLGCWQIRVFLNHCFCRARGKIHLSAAVVELLASPQTYRTLGCTLGAPNGSISELLTEVVEGYSDFFLCQFIPLTALDQLRA